MKPTFEVWKLTITRGASTRAIAAQLNSTGPRIKRHLESDPPAADMVIELARVYGANPVEGLIAAGLLTHSDVDQAATKDSLARVPMLHLLEEALARERQAVKGRSRSGTVSTESEL
ncbi:hypothetical protein JK358_37170 [Nocardia sp. 2]|uniref:Uncharacterized protein n=1 Tax=Nocardia acididurans TaxID=2802282 RepID=A0ABS1MHA4_9NOCA|nr:hypothetical protein [Nocardia acididurans]MBL1080043.1 hypothetical protein [Nocardia acididurans]